MHLSDELETPKFDHYSDLSPEQTSIGKYFSLPAHLILPKDTQTDYIRLVQIYPIVQEGF